MTFCLCLVTNEKFYKILEQAAPTSKISLTIVRTLKEFNLQLTAKTWDAIILNGHIENSKSFQEIFNKIKENTLCAFIFDETIDGHDFREFKEKLNVHYVFETPSFLQDTESFLAQIMYDRQQLDHPIAISTDDFMAELRTTYIKTIPEKVERLDLEIKALKSAPTLENLKTLKGDVHKIAGSAGTYCYSKISEICKTLEIYIIKYIDIAKDPSQCTDCQLISVLDFFLKQVKFYFHVTQYKSVNKPEIGPESSTVLKNASEPLSEAPLPSPLPYSSNSTVYIVDQDHHILDLLYKRKQHINACLICEKDPENALNQLENKIIVPQVLIVGKNFPSCSISGYKLIEAACKDNRTLRTIGIILDNDDLNERIDAVSHHVNNIFIRPVSADALLNIIKESFQNQSKAKYKVLVIDDDADVCEFIAKTLTQVGIEVRSLNEGTLLYQTLKNYQPDLLILDIFLPGHNGIQLLQTLRADVLFSDLIIMIITGKNDPLLFEKAHANRVDDIIYKPLDAKKLQTRTLSFLDKKSLSHIPQELDPLTGLHTLSFLQTDLIQELSHHQISGGLYALALFEINQFDNLVSIFGENAVNSIIISTVNFIISEFQHYRSFSYIGKGRFGILFQDINFDFLQTMVSDLLKGASQQVSLLAKNDIKITFDCGITYFPEQTTTANALLEMCEKSLLLAKSKERDYSSIVLYLENEQKIPKKNEVLLLDDDVELVNILVHALEQKGITVKVAYTGQEALDYLLKSNLDKLPLIISDRMLPDMDGLEMLRQLKQHFSIKIPILFISALSSESEMVAGLAEGALDYIKKPLNLTLFLIKISNLLSH